MVDIGPFQNIIAVGWGESQIDPSDTGWDVSLQGTGVEFVGAPVSWVVRLTLPPRASLDGQGTYDMRVGGLRYVVFDRPQLITVDCDFLNGGIAGPRGSEDTATVSTTVSFYQQRDPLFGDPQISGDPNGFGTLPAGEPFEALVGLTSGVAFQTIDRPAQSSLDVTFTFTPI